MLADHAFYHEQSVHFEPVDLRFNIWTGAGSEMVFRDEDWFSLRDNVWLVVYLSVYII